MQSDIEHNLRSRTQAARVLRAGPILLCMGLFSRFYVWALRCTAPSASKTSVSALAEALHPVRDTRARAYLAITPSRFFSAR